MSSDDDECSIQWTNGEPQGEAAYVIESAEGMFSLQFMRKLMKNSRERPTLCG